MAMKKRAILSAIVLAMLPALAAAEVSRVEIVSRRDVLAGRAFGDAGAYELIAAKIHFAASTLLRVFVSSWQIQAFTNEEDTPRA